MYKIVSFRYESVIKKKIVRRSRANFFAPPPPPPPQSQIRSYGLENGFPSQMAHGVGRTSKFSGN